MLCIPRRCFALLVLLALCFAAPLHAADKLRVLLIDGQNNHKWQTTTPILVKALESSGRFTVDVSTTPPKGSKPEAWADWHPNFSDYAAVVSNYNGERWPKPVEDAFVSYVQNGGGLVVVHAANNSFSNWPEYNEMIGLGGWGGRNEKAGPYVYYKDDKIVRDDKPGPGGHHGHQHPFVIQLRVADHPITRGMPAQWLHAQDELYDSLRGPAEHMTILATAFSDPKEGGTGRDEPMIMVLDYGKGRVFHTPMGHADYSMKDVGFFVTVARGTEWAATGEVTIPIPDNFPTADKLSPVE
ncbi:MAG: ThuA domain-containing protein [Planctomycetes bacterium]|nr:ThuA domain-containing protein [Planctomycetota bacterium]